MPLIRASNVTDHARRVKMQSLAWSADLEWSSENFSVSTVRKMNTSMEMNAYLVVIIAFSVTEVLTNAKSVVKTLYWKVMALVDVKKAGSTIL